MPVRTDPFLQQDHPKTIGYARVSTSGQTLDAQLEQLKTHGCDQVFRETMSGARADRPELKNALATLSDGDILVVTRLDRLARSTRDLLDIVHTIETRGAKLKSLADTWADTTTPTGKLILTVLGGLAEFERSLIRERTSEGRERARKAGRHLGRPFKLTPYQREQALKMRREGQDNAEIARVLGVSRSTVSRIK
ncbi:MAG: recombinase family protein [Desulfomicrobium sp.]|uniref:recombinase family protein n=1 Tax=Hoeflea sp. TaxID=1940281 RepID=UPI0025C5FE06|nr:recombinase family protein [Hoeflea sp.]MBV1711601.1 recombinase family protein [Desulfomicrobium sp.]MBV1782323.1 recombinase family protein [Hoeflea sp.]